MSVESSNKMLEEVMLEQKVWAVVGVNEDRDKFGNRIYRRLRDRGYEVYAINPGLDQVEGDPCYHSLSELPKVPQVVDMVVSPKIGKAVLDEAATLGVSYIWLQPGTHNEEILAQIDANGLTAVQGCVLIATA